MIIVQGAIKSYQSSFSVVRTYYSIVSFLMSDCVCKQSDLFISFPVKSSLDSNLGVPFFRALRQSCMCMSSNTMHLQIGSVNKNFVSGFHCICISHMLILFFTRESYLSLTQEWFSSSTYLKVSSSNKHILGPQMQFRCIILEYYLSIDLNHVVHRALFKVKQEVFA